MNAVTFDTLKYANALKAAGFTPEQAEAQVNAQAAILYEVLEANRQDVATKGDLSALKNELKSDMAALKNELKSDMATLKNVLQLELQKELAPVKSDILLLKWMVGVIVAGVVALVVKAFFSI